MKTGKYSWYEPRQKEYEQFKDDLRKLNKKALKGDKFIFSNPSVYIDKIKDNDDLIYDDCRYIDPNTPPMSVYLPSKALVFKMMKACVNCMSKEQLWIYKDNDCEYQHWLKYYKFLPYFKKLKIN